MTALSASGGTPGLSEFRQNGHQIAETTIATVDYHPHRLASRFFTEVKTHQAQIDDNFATRSTVVIRANKTNKILKIMPDCRLKLDLTTLFI